MKLALLECIGDLGDSFLLLTQAEFHNFGETKLMPSFLL